MGSESMAAAVAALLKEKGHTVSVSESSAGGLISASLVSVPGASAYYLGGAVCIHISLDRVCWV